MVAAGLAGAQTNEPGRQQYEARCAGCHGADGAGGGHGPTIINLPSPRAATQDAVRVLIQKGVPAAGMPAFPISDQEAGAIAAYVLRLRQPATGGPTASGAVQGDAAA